MRRRLSSTLVRLAAASLAAAATLAPARAPRAQPPADRPADARAPAAAPDDPPEVAAARLAVRAFERARRRHLAPYHGGTGGPCEVRLGRLCYWDNNDDQPPPPERPAIARERDALLDRLARAADAAPQNEWIAGQRVRYLVEARRRDEAVDAATACRAAPWWCHALRGLALHERGDHGAAAAAFDTALGAMPPERRCEWTDVSLWLDGRAERAYRRLACGPERDRWEARLWSVAAPLLMLPGNDLRSELLARRVMTRVESESGTPFDLAWGSDIAELEVRYGWPTAWSARPHTPGSLDQPGVVGHEPTPSFDFIPSDGALEHPERAAARDWDLRDPRARMRYAPRYATRGFAELPHQLARFRRGDSMRVVGAWDVDRDRGWDAGVPDSLAGAPRVVDAGLVLADGAGASVRATVAGAPRRGALAVALAAGPALASLEVLDVARARAGRARYGIEPLPPDAVLSDLLLLTRGGAPDADLDAVLDRVLGAPVVRAGGVVGLYWETYLRIAPRAPVTVSVRATRLDTRWHERARSRLGIGTRVTPVAVRFTDVGRPDGAPGRSLTLTWPSVPRGDYRVELTVEHGDEAASTSLVVRVE